MPLPEDILLRWCGASSRSFASALSTSLTFTIVLEPEKNYFELFDLPLSYTVDERLLADRYRVMTRSVETQFEASGGRRNIGSPARSMTQIEDAYRTLLDPLTRADYLLGLYLPVDGAAEQATETLQSQEGAFLMERMELSELLAESAHRSDPATAVAEVLTQLAEQSAALDKDLQGLFAEPSPQNLCAAREIVRKLELLGTCRRDAEAWLGELGVQD